MLNIKKKTHPARQMHDTFYTQEKAYVLRTHTRHQCKLELCSITNHPMSFASSGKVYRKDDDATHLPMFHQVEGICVDDERQFCTT